MKREFLPEEERLRYIKGTAAQVSDVPPDLDKRMRRYWRQEERRVVERMGGIPGLQRAYCILANHIRYLTSDVRKSRKG